jgi:hypothetical protein
MALLLQLSKPVNERNPQPLSFSFTKSRICGKPLVDACMDAYCFIYPKAAPQVKPEENLIRIYPRDLTAGNGNLVDITDITMLLECGKKTKTWLAGMILNTVFRAQDEEINAIARDVGKLQNTWAHASMGRFIGHGDVVTDVRRMLKTITVMAQARADYYESTYTGRMRNEEKYAHPLTFDILFAPENAIEAYMLASAMLEVAKKGRFPLLETLPKDGEAGNPELYFARIKEIAEISVALAVAG